MNENTKVNEEITNVSEKTTDVCNLEEEKKEPSKTKKVFKKILDFIVVTMNGMAFGLFSTLIIGVIIERIGILTNWDFLLNLATLVKKLMHVGIGVGIAWALKFDGIKLIVVGICGGICLNVNNPSDSGDPLVTYLVVISAALFVKYVYFKKTPVDIIIVPLGALAVAYGVYSLINTPVHAITVGLGNFINYATDIAPFFMGIVIAVLMGMALTAPISSAAIAITIGLSGIAGGAAVVGCCCQMVGFAIMSRKDNNAGMIFSIAVGTSMLQFKNILKKPVIWLPTIIASAILGPMATLLFKLECTSAGAGMGTSGLVGIFGTFDAMGSTPNFYLGVILLELVLPVLLVFGLDLLFRKLNLIKPGDLKV